MLMSKISSSNTSINSTIFCPTLMVTQQLHFCFSLSPCASFFLFCSWLPLLFFMTSAFSRHQLPHGFCYRWVQLTTSLTFWLVQSQAVTGRWIFVFMLLTSPYSNGTYIKQFIFPEADFLWLILKPLLWCLIVWS